MLTLLREEGRRRGFLAGDCELTAEKVFALVRDMPYQRASSRAPEAIVREWRGTCSGKHYLLVDLFHGLGFESRVVMCPHYFTQQNTVHFPAALREQVSREPVPDVHTFIRLKTGSGWMDVDATWPLQTRSLGMPVNERFRLGVDMKIACDPIEILDVPTGLEPRSFKEKLIRAHCGTQLERRDRFIEDMSRWLADSTA